MRGGELATWGGRAEAMDRGLLLLLLLWPARKRAAAEVEEVEEMDCWRRQEELRSWSENRTMKNIAPTRRMACWRLHTYDDKC